MGVIFRKEMKSNSFEGLQYYTHVHEYLIIFITHMYIIFINEYLIIFIINFNTFISSLGDENFLLISSSTAGTSNGLINELSAP